MMYGIVYLVDNKDVDEKELIPIIDVENNKVDEEWYFEHIYN